MRNYSSCATDRLVTAATKIARASTACYRRQPRRGANKAFAAIDFRGGFVFYISNELVRQIEQQREEWRVGGHHPNLTSGASEADAPHSLVLRLGAERPLTMDAGVELAPLSIAYQTYGALNDAKTQRHSGLPRPDRRPACRQPQSGDRQGRLVGYDGRPRQADRHRPFLRHLRQCRRRLHGNDRAGVDQSRDRRAPMASTCRSSPSPTWCAPRRC